MVQEITATTKRMNTEEWADELYKPAGEIRNESVNLILIPYFAWANPGIVR